MRWSSSESDGLCSWFALMFGPRRFGELREDLPGISANVLTQRLEGLQAAGILVRRQLPSPANAQFYELTPWGDETEPIFQALGRWAARSPSHDPSLPISGASVLLSSVVYGGRSLADAQSDGALTVEGDRATAKTFVTLFALPPKVTHG